MSTATATATTDTTDTTDTTPVTDARTVAVAIKASPEQVWEAITDGAVSPVYYYGFTVESTWAPDAEYAYTVGGQPVITGRILDLQPAEQVTMTFNGRWDPAVAELPESTVTYRISPPPMPTPGVSVLTLRHDGLGNGPAAEGVHEGWVMILSGLKTLLETGSPLIDPGAG